MGEGQIGDSESPYKTSFEKAFLRQSAEFYQKESEALLLECDAPSIMQKVRFSSRRPVLG